MENNCDNNRRLFELKECVTIFEKTKVNMCKIGDYGIIDTSEKLTVCTDEIIDDCIKEDMKDCIRGGSETEYKTENGIPIIYWNGEYNIEICLFWLLHNYFYAPCTKKDLPDFCVDKYDDFCKKLKIDIEAIGNYATEEHIDL